MDIEAINDPTAFLDRICESVTGVRKAYISDAQGVILAESSAPQDQFAITLVRSFPNYFDRLGKLSFGESQSVIVEGDDCSFVVLVSSPLYLTFICDQKANFALLTEIPNEMREFLDQLKGFIENS